MLIAKVVSDGFTQYDRHFAIKTGLNSMWVSVTNSIADKVYEYND